MPRDTDAPKLFPITICASSRTATCRHSRRCCSACALLAMYRRRHLLMQLRSQLEPLLAHRDSLLECTLSNVKGNRSAPPLPARVTCSHSSQTNLSVPAMCVFGISWAQSWICLCAVTFPQPTHSFVIICASHLPARNFGCVYRKPHSYCYVTESPNVNGDDRAALLLPDPVRLAVQVEEPT